VSLALALPVLSIVMGTVVFFRRRRR
jgi:hypothetical protein